MFWPLFSLEMPCFHLNSLWCTDFGKKLGGQIFWHDCPWMTTINHLNIDATCDRLRDVYLVLKCHATCRFNTKTLIKYILYIFQKIWKQCKKNQGLTSGRQVDVNPTAEGHIAIKTSCFLIMLSCQPWLIGLTVINDELVARKSIRFWAISLWSKLFKSWDSPNLSSISSSCSFWLSFRV